MRQPSTNAPAKGPENSYSRFDISAHTQGRLSQDRGGVDDIAYTVEAETWVAVQPSLLPPASGGSPAR
jgi:hypothetical protein